MAYNHTWILPESSVFYKWTMDWRLPIITSITYTIIVSYWTRQNLAAMKGKAQVAGNSQWSLFKAAVVAHNVLLALFSAKTFMETAPVLWRAFWTQPIFDSVCDPKGLIRKNTLDFWAWIFYLSKYYELIDTFILLIKGKPSSFLQTYHHAGAIIGMWLICASHLYGGWVFVTFNSFIHTIMYSYYTMTCFGYTPSWKRFMTYMQITQFIVGMPMAFIYMTWNGCVPTAAAPNNMLAKLLNINGYWSSFMPLIFNFSYVTYLIFLFVDFARRTYFGKKAKRS